jgi:hypothetical protein
LLQHYPERRGGERCIDCTANFKFCRIHLRSIRLSWFSIALRYLFRLISRRNSEDSKNRWKDNEACKPSVMRNIGKDGSSVSDWCLTEADTRLRPLHSETWVITHISIVNNFFKEFVRTLLGSKLGFFCGGFCHISKRLDCYLLTKPMYQTYFVNFNFGREYLRR